MIAFDSYRSRKEIPSLDALRALSVMLVITVHVHIGSWYWLSGARGVTIFFIISGYLITFLTLREERELGSLNLRAFYIRRLFRILPAYLLTLSVYIVLILILQIRPDKVDNFKAALPFFLVFMQEIPFFLGVNGANDNIAFYQSWSLGIEEKFYLVWPIIIFVILQKKSQFRLPFCVILAVASAAAPHLLQYGTLLFSYFHILVGSVIAFLLDNRRVYSIMASCRKTYISAIALLIFFAMHFAGAQYSFFPYTGYFDVTYTLVAGMLFMLILVQNDFGYKFWNLPFLKTVGRLSYGIYLFHVLCLNISEAIFVRFVSVVPTIILSIVNLIVAVGMSIMIALLVSKTVEQPFIAFGKRLSKSLINAAKAEPKRLKRRNASQD